MRQGAILASNTSALNLDEIAEFTKRPQDVIGLHFFSPANVMRLLEIVRGAKTAKDVLATAMQLAKKIGKVAVISGVCDGFIGNRMVARYGAAAHDLIMAGALPQQVDAALQEFGMAMGPFRMGDLAGLDIGMAGRKRRAAEFPDRDFSNVADDLCAAGRFGQKTGAGWYRYEAGSRNAIPDPAVTAIIEKYRKQKGITPRKVSNEEIVERCIYALVNEGARIVEDGIAQRSSDIDVVYLNGYGFPPWRGGPMFYADQMGLSEVARSLRHIAAQPNADKAVWTSGAAARAPELGRQDVQCIQRTAKMTEAVIVSTARTGLGKSWKGAFNMTYGATLGAHSVQHAVARAGIDPAEVEDVIMGSTFGEGTTGGNIARQIALRAGLPITTAGLSINRFCSSGLQSIALAAQRVMTEGAAVIVAGGLESISCVQNETNTHMRRDPWIDEHKPTLYWSMLQTAETVAKRYNISKEAQDEYGVRSQLRAAAGQAAGKFKDEIVPMTTTMGVVDKNTGAIAHARGHHLQRRGHSSRHHPRGRREDSLGHAGRRHHGGQCQPVLRWQQRLRGDGRQARGAARPQAVGGFAADRHRRRGKWRVERNDAPETVTVLPFHCVAALSVGR